MRKGIILAGGSGTRLYPSTLAISKQIIPIYDKPMIYYPLSVLMQAEIKNYLVISTPDHISSFERLLGDGSFLGINISYKIQKSPNGIAESFLLAKDFLAGSHAALILGDNIFYGSNIEDILISASNEKNQNTIFATKVSDPERFGVIEFDDENQAVSIEEKPKDPKSNYVVTGLYFYDSDVTHIAGELKLSERGELEITDLNKKYLSQKNLHVQILPEGFVWLDTGTPESLFEASSFVKTIEKKQGIKICCPEKIAIEKNWVTKDEVLRNIKKVDNSYTNFIKNL
tara:strand:- start:557 stop:1414 length:858 start_codon:yes stop_codon:yes gene_type:complete